MTTVYEIEYEPHEHQQRFHQSKAKLRLILSGIRGGKTIAGTLESLFTALDTVCVGAVVAASYRMLLDVVIPEFFRYCPKELIADYSTSDMSVTLINGSKILFRSADAPERLRGLDLNWFWLDEAAIAKQDAYDILLGRISQKAGRGWITTTPKGHNWIYREVYKRWKEGNPDYDVIEFRSIDNPYFPPEEIEKLKRLYTTEFFQQELEAKFVQFAGLVYKDFNRLIHVKIMEKRPPCRYYMAGVDWGFTNPTCILVIGVNPDDKIFVVKEWFQERRTIQEITQAAQQLQQQYEIETFYCDPSEPSFIEQFRRAGLSALPAVNEIMPGINKVSEKLRQNQITISPDCENLIDELESYQYPEQKGITDVKEAPLKVNDHAVDALRYAIASFKPKQRFIIR